MALCILHLGSEKTGTSSIQKYFGTHRPALLNEGVWYPKSFTNPAGHVHLRLSDAAADGTLDKAGFGASDFREEYASVREQGFKTAVFSSEFFHSQLRDRGSVERLHKFLSGFFDDIRLIYYARRQDQMLASMHSTAVQGAWTTNRSALSVYETKGHYYFDHAAVCDLWAAEFGRERLTCRIYERDKLVNGDIVDDFSTRIGLELDEDRAGVASNESLSFETMCVLLLLNGSRHKDNKELRRKLIATGKKRNGKRIPMLTRGDAKAFLSKFADSNRTFFSRYVDPKLATDFSSDFVAFPEAVPPPPGADALLDFVFSGKP
ncbi:MAG TPA: hypothetical protein VG889_20900 [Rhizomicrobium sp.]|nr:hypothetical protein [Rhizomicrobium sp.]